MPAVKPPAAAKGPLGVLKKKVGPAPLWVWFAVGLLLFVVYRRFSGAANNTGATPVTPQTSPGTTMDGSGGTSGGGGQASGSGMGADPNQLLDAYRSGGSDYANIFGSLLPYFYSGQGSTDTSAFTPVGSTGGAAFEGAQIPTVYSSVSHGGGSQVTWLSADRQAQAEAGRYSAALYRQQAAAPHETARFSSTPTPAPKISTKLLPSGGFGRPHTVTGGF